MDDSEEFEATLSGFPQSDSPLERGRDPLEVLLTQFLAARRDGIVTSVEQFARANPQYAEEILDLFPVVAAMEKWKSGQEVGYVRDRLKQSLTIESLGQYDIVREVGRGAMGIVFEAIDRQTRERVAVKAFPWHLTSGTHWKRRFEEEARTAGRLRHKNVVPVLGFGEQGGFCYYVMRYIDGVSLDWIIHKLCSDNAVVYAHEIASLRPGGGLPTPQKSQVQEPDAGSPGRSRSLRRNEWRKIATIGLQVAEALQAAHRAGTGHRDIKPANLLLDTSGKVWVTDFGLAAAIHPDTTDSGMSVAGTVRYMAPELFLGHRFDERSDVYSLGATLYELATLSPTFSEEDRMQMVHHIVQDGPPLPRVACPEIPVDFERIILNAMQRDPEVRYASAAQLISDLLRFLNGQPVKLRRLSFPQRVLRHLGMATSRRPKNVERPPDLQS